MSGETWRIGDAISLNKSDQVHGGQAKFSLAYLFKHMSLTFLSIHILLIHQNISKKTCIMFVTKYTNLEILFRLWTDQLCILYVLSYLTQCSIMHINVYNSGSQDSDKTIIQHSAFTRCLFIISDYAFFIKTHFISLTVLTCILNMLAITDAEFSGNKSEHFSCLKVTSDSSSIINWP